MRVLREMNWLNGGRAHAWRGVLIAVTLATMVGWVSMSRAGVDPLGKPLGTDFLAFWSAARLAVAGTPEAAWDLVRLGAMERAATPVDPGVSSFLYPPPFLLVCLPFGLLPYPVALLLWLAAGIAAFVAAVRPWLPAHRGRYATLLAFPAVATTIGHGQNAFLTAALLAAGLRLVGTRPWLAGALLGCLVIKPQLALALPVLVIAGGRWHVMLGAIASATMLCAASLAGFGAEAWRGFLGGGAIGRAIVEQGLVEHGKMVSASAAIHVLGGGAAAGYAAQAGVATFAAILLAVAARRGSYGGQAATAVIATLLMSPFLLDYDLLAMAVPLAWLFGEGLRRGFAPWEKAILLAAFVLPLVSRDLAMIAHLPVAPIVMLALLWATARAAGAPRPAPRPQIMAMPPLTCSVWPVTYPASRDAR